MTILQLYTTLLDHGSVSLLQDLDMMVVGMSIPSHYAYYLNLHMPKVINNLRYRFKDKTIIYGIRSRVTNMIYIGSTTVPVDRFRQHLLSGLSSNLALQEAIRTNGLAVFTAYVFEEVHYPTDLDAKGRRAYLFALEQSYMDKFDQAQLYNSIRTPSL